MCIKRNAFGDEGMVVIAIILNRINGLQTIESCEGHKECGFIFFEYGEWKEIGGLVFEIIAPPLLKTLGEDVHISVDIFNIDTPRAELRFRIEAKKIVTSILNEVLNLRKSRYFYDKYRIRFRN